MWAAQEAMAERLAMVRWEEGNKARGRGCVLLFPFLTGGRGDLGARW